MADIAPPSTVTISALGDLMLAQDWNELAERGLLEPALGGLAERTQTADLRFANLEVTLEGNEGVIPKQPRVIGSRRTVETVLRYLGIDVVSVANNHAFDCYLSGFQEVENLLEGANVRYCGAGIDPEVASKPVIFELRGIRVGLLAYAALDTKPSHVINRDEFGVNPLEENLACSAVERLKARVDHVLVSLHWGVEYTHLPSPHQVRLARRLVDCGASLVIGHHAHVVQGVEAYGSGIIAFNLGNAAATDLIIDGRLAIRKTAQSSSSFELQVEVSKEGVVGFQATPFRFDGSVIKMADRSARRYLRLANRYLERGITEELWRRRRLFEDVVLRTLRKLHPRVILSVRPAHFSRVLKNLRSARSGRGPD